MSIPDIDQTNTIEQFVEAFDDALTRINPQIDPDVLANLTTAIKSTLVGAINELNSSKLGLSGGTVTGQIRVTDAVISNKIQARTSDSKVTIDLYDNANDVWKSIVWNPSTQEWYIKDAADVEQVLYYGGKTIDMNAVNSVLRLKRMTHSNIVNYVGISGEIVVDVTNNTARIFDGVLAGGYVMGQGAIDLSTITTDMNGILKANGSGVGVAISDIDYLSITGTAAKSTNVVGGTVGNILIQTDTDETGFITEGAAGTYLGGNGTGVAPTFQEFPTDLVTTDNTVSVDGELTVYDSTSGKKIKKYDSTGLVKTVLGVASSATAGQDYVKPDTMSDFTAQQTGTQAVLTSAAAHIATDCNNGNNFVHTMTESTTLDNPTHIKAGTDYKWTFIQHASSAKTLALGNFFKTADGKVFVGLPTTVGSVVTLVAYAETTTSLVCSLIKKGLT